MSNTLILAVVIAVLIVQWPLAMLATVKLFSDGGQKKYSKPFVIIFNTAIIFVPLIGPLSYFIYRTLKIKKDKKEEIAPDEDKNQSDTEFDK